MSRSGPTPLRVAAWYLVFGLAWIWLTGLGLGAAGVGDAGSFWAEAAKGTLFVAVSAGVVYRLVRADFRELARVTDLLRAVVDGTTDAVFVKDRDGRYLLLNEAASRFVGVPVRDVLGRDDTALFDPDSARIAMGHDRQVMEAGRSDTAEETLTAAGVRRTYLATKAPLRDRDGRVVGVIGISRDITDRKAAEQAFRDLADAIPQIVWTARPDGSLDHFNARALAYAGLALDDLTGWSWEAVLHPDDLPAARAAWADILRTGRPRDLEFRLRRADGAYRWHVARQVPAVGPDGAAYRWYGTCTDIHDRRQAEEALRLQNRVLEQIAAGEGLPAVLDTILDLLESQVPGSIGSVLTLDRSGQRLRVAAARGLPAAYNAAVDGLAIGPAVGSCGTAAYRGETVVVADIATDPLWEPYRDLALGHGLRACWSVPIRPGQAAGARPVLGTFALYQREAGEPSPAALEVVAGAAYLAGIALERDAALRRLRESEERYRRLVDVLPNAVFLAAGGRVTFCNPALLALVGAADPAEVLGRPPFDLFHPDSHEPIRRRIAAAEQTGQPAPPLEEHVLRRDGRVVPVVAVATPTTDQGERSTLLALSDLTERQRSAELLRAVLASVRDAIVTVDGVGTVVSVNPAVERVFGYPADELVGQAVARLLPAAADGLGADREVPAVRRDGTTFPAELTVTEFLMAGERHATAVVRDLTARRQLEEQLRHAHRMEGVGRLAGGVAHDFNNLLTVINGYCDVLLDGGAGDGPDRDALRAIRDAGERAARLTQQLLAFSRKAIVEPKVLDVNGLLADSARLLRRLIGEHIAVATDLAPDLPPIKADPGQIEQVVLNLVVNARDAMPDGGRVTIRTRTVLLAEADAARADLAPGVHVEVAVADTGCGMPADVLARIFEPFYTTKGVGQGTGLGLAVVHGIVRQAGGHVAVASEVGRGTTFTLLFPAVSRVVGGSASGTRPPAAGTETVLLVEDEDLVRTIARQGLDRHGYRVLEARGGEEAIRLAAEHAGPIHLLVTDVVMPGLGGRQVADAVRGLHPALRILYMSGYTDDAIVRAGIVEAEDAFLHKPFTAVALARKVRAVLDGTG